MNQDKILILLDIINELVFGDHIETWQEIRDIILKECDKEQKTALQEFASWFD